LNVAQRGVISPLKFQIKEVTMWRCDNWGTGLPFGLNNLFMGFGPFGALLGLVFFIFIIYVIAKLVMTLFSKPNANPDRQDSLTILKNRFAKGEITQEEYDRMREVLIS
jgi:putative membrane protein